MMTKDETRKKSNSDLVDGKLLHEVEAISKALYLDKNVSRSSSSISRNQSRSSNKGNGSLLSSKSKHGSEDLSAKDKKSFWNWKPLKALSHIGNRRFNCCFTLEVHSIEGLPPRFNNRSLCVHWKRRDGEVLTSPVKVVEGVAEFEQKLTHTCSIYGSRSGPHHSVKYEAKHFLLYAAVHENSKVDLGKHRVDLTKLLPLTLEELEDEKNSGTWTTNFKLLGEAKGAVLNVSFGYLVLGDTVAAPTNKNVLQLLDSKSTARSRMKSNQVDGKGSISRAGSFPVNQKPLMTRSVDDIKVLHEVTPVSSEFSNSVMTLYQLFDDEKSDSLVDDKCEITVSPDDTEPIKPGSCSPSHSSEKNIVDENVDAEFSVLEKGMDSLEKKDLQVDEDCSKVVEEVVVNSLDRPIGCSGAGDGFQVEPSLIRDEVMLHDSHSEEKDLCTKELLLEDLESALSRIADLEKEGLDTPEVKSEPGDYENQTEDGPSEKPQSLQFLEAKSEQSDYGNQTEDGPSEMPLPANLDDMADSVADEFLTMLGLEESPHSFGSDEPESPRERLLREFQKEAEASGCSLFGFDIDEEDMAYYDDEDVADDDDYDAPTISGWKEFPEDSDYLPVGESEYPKIRVNPLPASELEYPKIRAKVIEDLETQVLMQEWGLDEKAFESSPANSTCGFGSPIDLPPEEPLQLPPLGEGLGPFVQTKTGGFLRSMNPVLFRDAKSGGTLIMQVSSPVVVPAELGSGVVEILQHLASVGLEKLSMQANKLMPLEDITGKTMQEIAWDAAPHLRPSERQNLLQDEPDVSHVMSAGKSKGKVPSTGRKSKKSSLSSSGDEVDSEYVSLEDLAPLAMDKIEALSIEGLRIQSDMSDEEAPSNVRAQSIGGKSASSVRSRGLEGAAGLQLLTIKDDEADDIDGLMGLSLTLDEWMRLDSGEIDEEQMSERTSKLLAAHHANLTDLNFLGKKGERKQGKVSGRRCGLLGNNFTVALMVQLRDPLRNYEPVGMPMLALIQVERVFVPPKPKIYCTVAQARVCDDEDDELESVTKEETKVELKEEKTNEEDKIPLYKVSEVHLSGLKTEPGKKKLWGNAAQQQSGSRWLLANGMGKGSKNPLMKSKVAAKSSMPGTITSQPGDTLWSISARYLGTGVKWKELASLNPHIRNPNVLLPNVTIKLR